MAMTKRARVMAALRGEPVDRVPLSFWLHNFVTENSAAGLAAETLRLARTFDWDFLKPVARAVLRRDVGAEVPAVPGARDPVHGHAHTAGRRRGRRAPAT